MRASLAAAFFALVFAIYLLTYSRAFDIVADEGTMFAVSESVVKRGEFSINQADNLQYIHAAAVGPDGARYSKYGLGQSLAAALLYGLGMAVPAFGLIDTVLLLNALAGAATATVVLLAAIELGTSPRRSLLTALAYAVCMPAWVYAKNFYSEPLTALGFALSAWGMVMALDRRGRAGASLAGAGLALAVLARPSEVVAAPVLLLVLWVCSGPRRWKLAVASAVPLAAAIAVIAASNWLRFGSPFLSGYGDEGFTVAPWAGALGMLFSPGRSLFLYAPILLIAVPGLAFLRRPAGLRAWLIGTALVVLLVHGAWWSWWGGWSWGPRFLAPILPLLTLGLLALDPALRRPSGELPRQPDSGPWDRRLSLAAVGLAAISFLIQLPGVLVYRTFFFWEVMKAYPKADPDAVSVYTFQFFMPLTNLREIAKGNLDLAWKQGFGAPVNTAALAVAVFGMCAATAGLVLALQNGRAGRIAAWVSLAVVAGAALASLALYQSASPNPYRGLGNELASRLPPNAVLLIGDHDPLRNRDLWDVDRSTLRLIGVPEDTGQMELHTLPAIRRAVAEGRPVWYLQTEPDPPTALEKKLKALGLSGTPHPLSPRVTLIEFAP